LIIREIISALFPPKPTLESIMQSGNVPCVLRLPEPPKPKAKPAKQEKPKDQDAYIIDGNRNQWGFVNDSTVLTNKSKRSAVPELTSDDITALTAEGYFADDSTTRGKESNRATREAKRLWCDGSPIDVIAARTNRSVSWVEKRVAVFGRFIDDNAG
jgi:hypothetical protein